MSTRSHNITVHVKQIENVDDNKLVDAVAKCGLKGLYLYDKPFQDFLAEIGLTPKDREAIHSLRWYAIGEFKEWPTLIGRIVYSADPAILHLTTKEWAKRLAGKTADEIEKLLDGTNQ
jgi:hypothetical protein